MRDSDFIESFLTSGTLISTKRGLFILGWGERQWLSSPMADLSIPHFYFPDFFLRNPVPWFTQKYWCEIGLNDFYALLESSANREDLQLAWENKTCLYFKEAFQHLERLFQKKELTKAVPYVFETARCELTKNQKARSLVNMLAYLRKNSAYLYGYWDENGGILGATPEILFCFNDQEGLCLETMACAATAPCDHSSLMHDPKELHEHRVVIQGILESLALFGEVKVGEMKLLELPTLRHLVTPITVDLKSQPDFFALVRALHPTPALGAFPREQGMAWLEDYQQKVDRNRYGAPVGFLHKGLKESCCYVAIRNAQWTKDQIAIGAGCGVVAESRLEGEWAEVNLKLKAIKSLMAFA